MQAGALNTLVQDLSLLSALGIRLVLVHGSRPQVNEQLRLKGYTQQFDRGLSPTDAAAGMRQGSRRRDPPGHRGRVQPGPAQHAHVALAHPGHLGNFVTARPTGVLDGVDYKHTGQVRKIDVDALKFAIEKGSSWCCCRRWVSPTGDAFNLAMEDLATSGRAARRNSSSCPARTAC